MSGLELKVPPPIVFLGMAAWMWLVARALPSLGFVFPLHDHIAIVLVAGGLITGILGNVAFRRAKTTVNPMKPDAASSLVTGGVYTITRNPMYLGGLVILTGWAVYLSNTLVLVFLPAYVLYINRFQIQPEERVLTSLFGKPYIAYQSRVRRWF